MSCKNCAHCNRDEATKKSYGICTYPVGWFAHKFTPMWLTNCPDFRVHNCDNEETCHGCSQCYQETGQFRCSKRCEHAERCECGHFIDLCESGAVECSESTC